MNLRKINNWKFISSEKLRIHGEKISTPDCTTDGWLPITVPGTVINGLVENKVYADPYEGTNMANLPGFKSESKHIFSQFHKPDDSPFRNSWWYRTELDIRATEGKHNWIRLDGISYCANVWLNGKRIAGTDYIRGTFRQFDIDITQKITNNSPNILAIEIFAPEPDDLGLTFIDWSPVPPDDCMGITQPAYTYTTGPVATRNLFVKSALTFSKTTTAKLTIELELENLSNEPCTADLEATIDKLSLKQKVNLNPREVKKVTFSHAKFPKLTIKNPRLWWPYQLGTPELYNLTVHCNVKKAPSSQQSIAFGIRSIKSKLNRHGARLFSINGKEILIRGAGWAPDMLMRQSIERDRADVAYIKNSNLNLVRFEGMMGSKFFMEECDREGVLVMAGWPCCNFWEKWEDWKPGDLTVACESLKSQILNLRSHPSLAMFLYGSDKAPPEYVEKEFVDILNNLYPELTKLSSAAVTPTKYGGDTGVKMTGPYAYVPPILWYKQEMRGAANLFNTETGPGMSIPPLESLLKMLPNETDRHPGSPTWNFHAGLSCFPNTIIDEVLIEKRFGKPTDIKDFALCAQVAGYEAWRAMYEAHNRNFPLSTGVVAWMLNSSWPSVIWQLYDFYLTPLGGFYGTQKACEQLHAQYSYDDKSIWLINSSLNKWKNISITATVYNLNSEKKFENKKTISVSDLSNYKVFTLPEISGLTTVYFLNLIVSDGNKELSRNFYWLATAPEVFAAKGLWYHFPLETPSDMSALRTLPRAEIKQSVKFSKINEKTKAEVTLTNNSGTVAFFIRARIFDKSTNDFIAPICWDNNCVSILPDETLTLTALFESGPVNGLTLDIEQWN